MQDLPIQLLGDTPASFVIQRFVLVGISKGVETAIWFLHHSADRAGVEWARILDYNYFNKLFQANHVLKFISREKLGGSAGFP